MLETLTGFVAMHPLPRISLSVAVAFSHELFKRPKKYAKVPKSPLTQPVLYIIPFSVYIYAYKFVESLLSRCVPYHFFLAALF